MEARFFLLRRLANIGPLLLFLLSSLPLLFSSRGNSDCHNAMGLRQDHDIAAVRGTEVLVRISGFAPQLDPQSMNQ